LDSDLDRVWRRLESARVAENDQAWSNRLAEQRQRWAEINDDRRARGIGPLELDEAELRRSWIPPHREGLREIRVLLDDGSRVAARSFEDAAKERAFDARVARGFEIELRSGEVSVALELDPMVGSPFSIVVGGLTLRAQPDSSDVAEDAFTTLRHWVDVYKPSFWFRWWDALSFASIPLFLIAIGTAAIAFDSGDSSEQIRRNQAAQLLQHFTPADDHRALELLLRFESHAREAGSHGPDWSRFFSVVVLLAVPLVLCAICPGSIVGLGRGEKAIARWKGWIRILFIAAPLFLVQALGAHEWVGKLLRTLAGTH
jgi:hypothetical protein